VTAVPGLEEFDGRLLDGLSFCRKAYRLVQRIRSEPDGIRELRLRSSSRAKKLVEEILPLAGYVQSRYGGGRILRVRWCGGSQSYDARIYWSGPAVDNLSLPRRRHAEVTTAVLPNAHLVRELVQAEGGAFGSRGTYRDPETRNIISRPIALDNADSLSELSHLVRSRIVEKSAKPYPPLTSLLVACEFETPLDPSDWRDLVQSVRDVPHPFSEVILLDQPMFRLETL
jgi:hypothetical protein